MEVLYETSICCNKDICQNLSKMLSRLDTSEPLNQVTKSRHLYLRMPEPTLRTISVRIKRYSISRHCAQDHNNPNLRNATAKPLLQNIAKRQAKSTRPRDISTLYNERHVRSSSKDVHRWRAPRQSVVGGRRHAKQPRQETLKDASKTDEPRCWPHKMQTKSGTHDKNAHKVQKRVRFDV